MKKAILFLLLITCTTQAYSQRLAKDEINKFTKDTIRQTTDEYLFNSLFESMQVSVIRINGEYVLKATYTSRLVANVYENNSFYLLMGPDEVIELTPLEAVTPDHLVGDSWQISPKYYLEPELVDKLRDGLVSEFRFETGEGYLEKKVQSKNYDVIGRCIKVIENY